MSEPSVLFRDPAPGLSTGELCELVARIAQPGSAVSDRDAVDRLEALERIKAAAAAAQADLTRDLDSSRSAQAEARARLADPDRVPRVNIDAGLSGEVALARRESPHQARAHLRLARRLHSDLPETYAALQRGDITERRALIVASETHDLSPDQRRRVDATIGPDLPGLGDKKLAHVVRRLVFAIDPDGATERRDRARSRRHVSHRVYGDGTAVISAVVSDHHLGAIVSSLQAQARLVRASCPDDPRSHTQLVADLFVERLAGVAASSAPPVALKLVLSAETLLGGPNGSGAAQLVGVGPIPAPEARALLGAGLDHALTSLQRLYALPGDGTLIAASSTSRTFRGALGDLIDLRDHGLCRTPWCNSPATTKDHARAVARGGRTTLHNGQGLCEAFNPWIEEPRDEASRNLAKEAHGWRTRTTSAEHERHRVTTTTPTGHRHHSAEPGLPVNGPPKTRAELYFSRLVLTA